MSDELKRRGYSVERVDGVTVVNGRPCDGVLYPEERRAVIPDSGDPDDLARNAFRTGAVAEQLDQEAKRGERALFHPEVAEADFVDDTGVVHPVNPPETQHRRRRGKGGRRR